MDTPPFLVWSLECACPIRGFQDGSDPQRTERHLRAAREAGRARAERRIFEGLALDPPLGFRIDEAIEIYGGQAALEETCGHCPCNALARADAAALAGCYGIVALPHEPDDFYAAIDRACAALDLSASDTTPRWFGLWQSSPLPKDKHAPIADILQSTVMPDAAFRTGIGELLLGLQTARDSSRPLHVGLYPPGRVEGPWWRLAPHCPACSAIWRGQRPGKCSVCGYVGHPAPDKKRHARGQRPYRPLGRMLGEEKAAELLRRYAAHRKGPQE